MALIVIVGLVWKFSSDFKAPAEIMKFSDFVTAVEGNQVAHVTITGNDITGATTSGDAFRVVVPVQYEGLGNLLLKQKVAVTAREATTSPWATLLYTWAP